MLLCIIIQSAKKYIQIHKLSILLSFNPTNHLYVLFESVIKFIKFHQDQSQTVVQELSGLSRSDSFSNCLICKPQNKNENTKKEKKKESIT